MLTFLNFCTVAGGVFGNELDSGGGIVPEAILWIINLGILGRLLSLVKRPSFTRRLPLLEFIG